MADRLWRKIDFLYQVYHFQSTYIWKTIVEFESFSVEYRCIWRFFFFPFCIRTFAFSNISWEQKRQWRRYITLTQLFTWQNRRKQRGDVSAEGLGFMKRLSACMTLNLAATPSRAIASPFQSPIKMATIAPKQNRETSRPRRQKQDLLVCSCTQNVQF